jgi:hypothetical protein
MCLLSGLNDNAPERIFAVNEFSAPQPSVALIQIMEGR